MTTHFSNGVTNVRGKEGGTSLFSGIKQPLITGGTAPQEWAFQDDFVQYNDESWTEIKTGSAYVLAQYPQGWLRIGDANPAGGEINGVQSDDVYQINTNKKWYFETSIAVTDVTELNTFVGFADNAYVNPVAVPDDGIGFSHLEDTTTIQFVSRKNGAGTSFTMLEAGSTFAQLDSTVATQSATVYGMPDNNVRLGFLFQPAGSDPTITADQYTLFINGTVSGVQLATTIPDDLLMEMKAFSESKGTVANDLYVDYLQTVQQR
tara:strand:- start:25 stop:813 length:789 start_codon:yes stop_codon:yes gene_type:complete